MDIKDRIEGILKQLRKNLQINETDLQLISHDEKTGITLINMKGLAKNEKYKESMGILKYGIMEAVTSSVPEVKEVRVV